jgi:hypothetical protein
MEFGEAPVATSRRHGIVSDMGRLGSEHDQMTRHVKSSIFVGCVMGKADSAQDLAFCQQTVGSAHTLCTWMPFRSEKEARLC